MTRKKLQRANNHSGDVGPELECWSFESGLRRLVRALDPAACKGGAAEFKSIYDWLFARLKRDGWSYPPGDHSVFLDLFRTFRNTLHNNGAFYSHTGADNEITWREVTYSFAIATSELA